MFGIFNSKKKYELSLVFDIRSSSVGGALIQAEETGVPKIIFSVREPIAEGEDVFNIDKFLFSMTQALDMVASRIWKSGLGVPKKIFCVLSSPWHVSQRRIISLKKDKPFVFSLKLADDLIKKEVLAFQETHLAQYAKTQQAVRLIELHNVKTKLNGYATHNLLDQKVEEVEMTLFISMSPEQVLSNIEDVIRKYFHFENIKYSSFTMSSFAVVHNLFINKANFLLIDVGGEVTDISMVKKNVLRESISFPMGRHFIIRELASLLSCSMSHAESYLSLYHLGHADTKTQKKLKPMIDKLQAEWLKNFQESLANLSKDISVPYTIYLSADEDFLQFFGEIIKAEQFNQYTLTESKFQIAYLNSETLHGVADFGKDTIRDPFLVIDSAYINHFLVYPAQAGQI